LFWVSPIEMSNIGMMEGAYFVGRLELLSWLNDLLKLDYTKVEQTASAAAHCQIMDAIYPGQVVLSKVNFNAQHEYEFVKNFKILQSVFDKQGIDKYVDVPKLVKAKYQDNLEFLQWIKRYFDLHNASQPGDYNPLERRKFAYVGDKKHMHSGATSGGPSEKSDKIEKVVKTSVIAPKKTSDQALKPKPIVVSKPSSAMGSKQTAPKSTKSLKPAEVKEKKETGSENSGNQVAELKATVEGLEKERDFYFGKLREIEILCQNSDPSLEVVQQVFKIMYATDDSEEFVSQESVPLEQDNQELQQEHQQEADEEIESF